MITDAGAPKEPTPTFCVLPWTHVATTVDGVWGRCCFDATNDYEQYYANTNRPRMALAEDSLGCTPKSPYAPDNPSQVRTLLEAFNSPAMRATRKAMLAGDEVAACTLCHDRDRRGLPSHRSTSNAAAFVPLDDLVASTAADGTVPGPPSSLDLRMGNTCNLRCTMCGFPTSSAHGAGTTPQWVTANLDPYRNDPTFWEALQAVTPTLRRIYFAGGEPFLQPGHRRVLEALISSGNASHIALQYNSNLTVLDDDILSKFPQFESVTIAASCDGTGEVFERIRTGGSWPIFVDNLRRTRGIVDIFLDATIQTGNIGHLDDLIAFARAERTRLRMENYVDYPTNLSVQGLSRDEKAAHTAALNRLAQQASSVGDAMIAAQLATLIEFLNSDPPEILT
jgi:sulfatase maturation enzyme AslB (radical SAM superfamily)